MLWIHVNLRHNIAVPVLSVLSLRLPIRNHRPWTPRTAASFSKEKKGLQHPCRPHMSATRNLHDFVIDR